MDQRDFLYSVVLIAYLLPCFHQVATVHATEPLLNGRATLYYTDLLFHFYFESAIRIANCNAAVNSLSTEPVMYSCRIWSRNNVIRIWCTGHDDPIKYSEFVTRHGLTNTPDRGTCSCYNFSHYCCFVIVFDAAVYCLFPDIPDMVYSDILLAEFPTMLKSNIILKQEFESGVTLTFFESHPVMTLEGHPSPCVPPDCEISSLLAQSSLSNHRSFSISCTIFLTYSFSCSL